MELLMTKTQEEWLEARKNRFTASVIHRLMGTPRGGGVLTKSAETFIYEKAAEILTGETKAVYGEALNWGIDHEADAFQSFQETQFDEYNYYGGETYVFIPYGEYSGYSPDGLNDQAIIEIKCPFNSGIHLKNHRIVDGSTLKTMHPEYYWQMQMGMICTDTNKGYFISYDPRMPIHKQMHIAQIERDDVKNDIDEKLAIATEIMDSILK